MKKISLSVLAILLFAGYSQAQAYEGTLKIKKVEEPAIIMVYNYSADVVENAFKANLADKRLKGSTSKGFLVYGSSIISEISPASLDYSFKFDEKGKRDKTTTTVYLLINGANVLVAGNDRDILVRNAKVFLENMMPMIEKSNLVEQIKKQENVLVQEEKKLKKLKDDQDDLEKKLKDNSKKQDAQQKEVNSQRSILDDLKARNK
jgi:hypothetical protein